MTPDEIKQEARELVERWRKSYGLDELEVSSAMDNLSAVFESFGQRCFEAGRVQALDEDISDEPFYLVYGRDAAAHYEYRNGFNIGFAAARARIRARMASKDSDGGV